MELATGRAVKRARCSSHSSTANTTPDGDATMASNSALAAARGGPPKPGARQRRAVGHRGLERQAEHTAPSRTSSGRSSVRYSRIGAWALSRGSDMTRVAKAWR
jgi:hypothetical protein